jgi:hypothetical protein
MKGRGFLRGAVAAVALGASAAAGHAVVLGRAASLSVSSASLTAYRTCTITATPATTTSIHDAEIAQDSASTNFGLATSISVRSFNSSRNRRAYVQFDIAACSPSIPSTASISKATLRMFNTALPSVCRTYDVFRVTAASWTEAGVTWGNQPFGTSVNNPTSSTATAATTAGTASCAYGTTFSFLEWTVTSDVQAWVSGTANYGWMIRDDSENSGTQRLITFAAKNAGQLDRAPQLVITYGA